MLPHDSQVCVAAATRAIDQELPDLARDVIRRYLDMNDAATQRFLEQPDAREEHQMNWHQWGIITHTRVFLRHFDDLVPRYLREWGLWEPIDRWMQQRIDGATRWELLRIAILLHDIGKFAARRRGAHRFHFSQHERFSGEIIRRDLDLARFGLTPAQIAYVAMTAEDHFVLGVVRQRARGQGDYNPAFVNSEQFVRIAQEIRREHPDDYIEIGILFLGDSLAKANPNEGPAPALSQYEINILVAHRYLQIVVEDGA